MAQNSADFDAMAPKMSAAIAALAMDAVEKAKSGHPGMPMGMADAATVLFTQFLKFDASAPDWADRDRFVLSAGHGSMLIYALNFLTGYPGVTIDQLKRFRQLGSKTAGHPEYGHIAGVETTTGPLGQGIANAVGMAMAEAHLAARFGKDLVDHYTYVIAGDGCLMEGISQEAIGLAGHLKLRKLIVLWDDNNISIDGAISLTDSTNQLDRFEASGWEVNRVDGHNMDAVASAIADARKSSKPSLIACKTTIGKGANKKAGTASAHGSPLGDEEIAFARKSLDWPYPAFEVPSNILDAWRKAGARGEQVRMEWEARLGKSSKREAFSTAMSADISLAAGKAVMNVKQSAASEPKAIATRVASQKVLEELNTAIPAMMGGSADLTGSNNTKTTGLEIYSAENYAGRYVHYGIREHGMAAAMNGIALHGGVVPYGGAFLVFSDYCRPSIRLAALMGIRSIFVMTHDSIGLGEDGPTHQPVEHMASLRAIPNLLNFRPADLIETAECWQLALENQKRPSVLALTRQNLKPVRLSAETENRSAQGGYVLADASEYQATIIATGSEVEIAMAAKDALAGENINVRVVSMPCLDLFDEQTEDLQRTVLGDKPRIVVEAGIRQCWDGVIYRYGGTGDFVGMSSFGASAPAPDLYKHFGITAQAVAAKVKQFL